MGVLDIVVPRRHVYHAGGPLAEARGNAHAPKAINVITHKGRDLFCLYNIYTLAMLDKGF